VGAGSIKGDAHDNRAYISQKLKKGRGEINNK